MLIINKFLTSVLLNLVANLKQTSTGRSEKKNCLCLELLLKGKHLCGALGRTGDVEIVANILK